MPARLAIVCTHPIQYNAPVFASLAQQSDVAVRVFYGWRGASESAFDHGFGQQISWDIPLLDGYDATFVTNVAQQPGSHHFRGIDLPSLVSEIRQWQADAVLVYGWRYKAHLHAMRQFKGEIPVLFRGDSTLLDERLGVKTWLRRRVLRWVYRHVDRALYVGTNNRAYFRAHGLRDDQLVFAPHAVDNERFANDCDYRDRALALREQLGIGADDVVVLFAGKLEPKKSPDLLLRSFAALARTNVHLVIAGSGVLEAPLKAKAPGNVHFLGFQNQSQMPTAYYLADLVTLPSQGPNETWGLALNEAMACGRAVLASDRVGAAVDLIRPGENGWIFASGNESALTLCLRQAVEMGREGLARMGRASKAIIEEWSIPKQVAAIVSTVSSIASYD